MVPEQPGRWHGVGAAAVTANLRRRGRSACAGRRSTCAVAVARSQGRAQSRASMSRPSRMRTGCSACPRRPALARKASKRPRSSERRSSRPDACSRAVRTAPVAVAIAARSSSSRRARADQPIGASRPVSRSRSIRVGSAGSTRPWPAIRPLARSRTCRSSAWAASRSASASVSSVSRSCQCSRSAATGCNRASSAAMSASSAASTSAGVSAARASGSVAAHSRTASREVSAAIAAASGGGPGVGQPGGQRADRVHPFQQRAQSGQVGAVQRVTGDRPAGRRRRRPPPSGSRAAPG